MSQLNTEKLLQEYKNAVDVSSIVSKTDPKGIITYANEAFCAISGYSLEELVGSSHSIVRHPDTPASAFQDMWKTIKNKQVWKGVIKNRKKDGGYYWVSATVVPIINAKDEIEEFIAIRQDITELQELTKRLEERVHEEVEKNREKDKKNIETLTCFLNSTPNLIIVYEENIVRFVNKNFLRVMGLKEEEILDKEYDLESIFEKRTNFLSLISEINKENYRENRVSVKSNEGRRIYYVNESDIPVSEDTLQMFTFNDITLNEYQKLKIKHYNERLEDYIKRRETKAAASKVNLLPEEPLDQGKEAEKVTRELSKEEKKVLKATRDGKTFSAEEYSHEIDTYVLTELQELIEIENEIEDALKDYEDIKSVKSLHTVSNRFAKYSAIINGLFEFKDLSFAISSLSNLLGDITEETIDESKQRKITMFLTNLTLDLSNWRRAIFVEKTAKDIHYLDSSLFSTILQLELIINENEELEDDGDDLELF